MDTTSDATRGRFDPAARIRFIGEILIIITDIRHAAMALPETSEALAVAIEARRQLADTREHLKRAADGR